MLQICDRAPAWVPRPFGVLPGVVLDFQNQRYWQDGVSGHAISDLVTTSRASTAYQDDLAGNWTSFGSNVLRVTNKGALIEEARTNSIRNNSMQGAVAGTPGTLPTNWSIGSTAGITSQIVGTGTESGVDYIDVRFSGTPSATNTSTRISFEGGGTGGVAATASQAWTASVFAKLSAGSLTNINSINLELPEYNAAGTFIGNSNPAFTPTSAALGTQRFTSSVASTVANTAFLSIDINLSLTSGNAIDITLRIGWPQLELGPFATSPIRTTSAAVTRAADAVTLTKAPTNTGAAQSIFFKGTSPNDTSAARAALEFSDGTSNNRIQLKRSSTANGGYFVVQGGSTLVNNNAVGAWSNATSAKIASAIATSDHAAVINAGTVATDATAGTLPALTKLTIGGGVGGDTPFDGYVERIALWPSTRLPNAALQQITAAGQ